MEVILREDVYNLGEVGQTVKVADGYARNYLLPRQMAVRIDSGSAKQIEHERKIIARRDEKRRAELTKVAKTLEAVTVEFKLRAGADEKLFGSVTTAHIAEKMAEQGHQVDRRSIKLEEPIKSLGIFTASVRLASGIEPSIKVWVNPLETEETQETPEASAEGTEEETD